jgi:hypothetical protein
MGTVGTLDQTGPSLTSASQGYTGYPDPSMTIGSGGLSPRSPLLAVDAGVTAGAPVPFIVVDLTGDTLHGQRTERGAAFTMRSMIYELQPQPVRRPYDWRLVHVVDCVSGTVQSVRLRGGAPHPRSGHVPTPPLLNQLAAWRYPDVAPAQQAAASDPPSPSRTLTDGDDAMAVFVAINAEGRTCPTVQSVWNARRKALLQFAAANGGKMRDLWVSMLNTSST